jgi:hypothetical protein
MILLLSAAMAAPVQVLGKAVLGGLKVLPVLFLLLKMEQGTEPLLTLPIKLCQVVVVVGAVMVAMLMLP